MFLLNEKIDTRGKRRAGFVAGVSGVLARTGAPSLGGGRQFWIAKTSPWPKIR
ncbi:MAG: hypothetical protein RIB69_05285 [Roseovarius sp.]